MSSTLELDPLKHTTLLLDTNLLLLFVAGSIEIGFVSKFRRTREFAAEDHATLTRFMALFSRFATTVSVLTEVSNLADSIPSALIPRYVEVFQKITEVFTEDVLPSGELSRVPEFARLGLTDAGIVTLAGSSVVVLTDDLDLYLALSSRNAKAFNFNHVRTGAWGRV